MHRAGFDIVVWLIIGVIFMLSKAWGKFVTPSDDDTTDEPVAPPRPRPARPLPAQRPAPPPVAPKPPPAWEAAPEELRRFMEQLTKPVRPTPTPPVAAPPVAHRAKPPAAKKAPAVVPPAPAPPTSPPALTPTAAATVTAKPRSKRSAQWITALRDRQNLRNIIISAEIIGRPKGLVG
jgi:hypothetical protein